MRPDGVVWLRDERCLTYPADALVVIGGPSGAGKSTLAARVLDAPPLDPDDVLAAMGPDAAWAPALARFEALLGEELRAGRGVVAVTTAVRRGHRIGLSRRAAEHGRECHLLMLDATPEQCRAGRAAQEEERIPDGLFEHLLREWAAFRRALADPADPEGSARASRRSWWPIARRRTPWSVCGWLSLDLGLVTAADGGS